MKKCVNCGKDLPDTAMHCAFCGVEQDAAPAAAPQDGHAKTLLGYAAADVLEQVNTSGQAAPEQAEPARAPHPRAPASGPEPASQPQQAAAFQPTLYAPQSGQPPEQESRPGLAQQPTLYTPQPGESPTNGAQAGPAQPPHASPSSQPLGNGAQVAQQPTLYAPQPDPPPEHGAQSRDVPSYQANTIAAPAPGGFPPAGGPPSAAPAGGPPPAAPPLGEPPPAAAPMAPQAAPPFAGHPPMGGPTPDTAVMPGAPHPHATSQVAPLQAPPYLASQTAARMGAPQEPWAESLKTLMLTFGIALVVSFVLPWSLTPQITFSWDAIAAAQGKLKLPPLLISGTGLLAVLLALLPLSVPVRGVSAAALGFVPVALLALVVEKLQWQSGVELISALTLISGLLLRSEYHDSLVPRVLVTIGVLCLLVPAVAAKPGLLDTLESVGKVPGKAKVEVILGLVPYLLAVIGLVLTWLPTAGAIGTNVLAWGIVIWPLVASLVIHLALGGSDVGAQIKAKLFEIFWSPITRIAWAALIGYGIASVVGKSLEHN